MEQFHDRADAADFIAGRLRDAGFGPAADQVAASIVDDFGQLAAGTSAPSEHRAMFRSSRWVIRSPDLGFVDALGGILQGTATGAALGISTGSVTAGMLAPALAVVTHLVKIAINVRSKGITLNETDFFVLAAVKEAGGPMSTAALHGAYEERFGSFPLVQFEKLLQTLAKYPSRAGEVALIWRGPDELWRCAQL